MRWLAIVILGVALGGCEKREEPAPAAAKVEQAAASNGCADVVILRVDPNGDGAWLTYMEHIEHAEGRAPVRIARSGNWGQPGEKFNYCE
jgi:hypothetical protein